jgi:hypothetical protein
MATNKNTWLGQLEKPITASSKEQQQMFNLARRQGQGATNALASEMENKMSGRGFRGGESGIADTAIGDIYSRGAEALGAAAEQGGVDLEKQARELNLSRALGGGGLQAQFDQMAQQNEQFGQNLGWEKNKFGQTLDFSKTQQDWQQQQDLMNMMFGLNQYMGNEQQQVWSPYYNAIGSADTYGG